MCRVTPQSRKIASYCTESIQKFDKRTNWSQSICRAKFSAANRLLRWFMHEKIKSLELRKVTVREG